MYFRPILLLGSSTLRFFMKIFLLLFNIKIYWFKHQAQLIPKKAWNHLDKTYLKMKADLNCQRSQLSAGTCDAHLVEIQDGKITRSSSNDFLWKVSRVRFSRLSWVSLQISSRISVWKNIVGTPGTFSSDTHGVKKLSKPK